MICGNEFKNCLKGNTFPTGHKFIVCPWVYYDESTIQCYFKNENMLG